MLATRRAGIAALIVVVGGVLWLLLRTQASRSGDLVPVSESPAAIDSAVAETASEPAPAAPEIVTERGELPPEVASPVVEELLGSLLVHVTWERDGAAADGIWVVCEHPRYKVEGRTGSSGTVTLAEVPPGRVSVFIDRGGRQSATVVAGQQTEMTFAIASGVSIHGLVVDVDGHGVGGAEIWMSSGNNFFNGHIVAYSTESGSFSIRDIGEFEFDRLEGGTAPPRTTGSRYVGARARGWAPSDIVTLDVKPKDYVWDPLRLVLPERGSSLSGLVLDPERRPVGRAVVSLTKEGRQRVNPKSLTSGGMASVTLENQTAITDAEGRFTFPGWPNGPSRLNVQSEQWATWSDVVELSQGSEAYREIVLSTGLTVTGVVSGPDGERVKEWVLVQCTNGPNHPHAYAAKDGSYSLKNVPAGEVRVLASMRDLKVSDVLHGRPGETITWNPVFGASGKEIRGRVLDGSGGPLHEWMVDAIEEASSKPINSAVTDAQGAFVLVAGVSGVSYRLMVRGGPIASMQQSDVRPGSGEIKIVVPTDRLPSVTIRGLVVSPTGGPIAGAQVRVTSEFGRAFVMTEEGSGKFILERLPPGSYRVSISAAGFEELLLEPHDVHARDVWELGTLNLPTRR